MKFWKSLRNGEVINDICYNKLSAEKKANYAEANVGRASHHVESVERISDPADDGLRLEPNDFAPDDEDQEFSGNDQQDSGDRDVPSEELQSSDIPNEQEDDVELGGGNAGGAGASGEF